MRFVGRLFLVLLILLSASSCKNRGGKDIDQGEIFFDIEYIGKMMSFQRQIMPKQLVVSFKDDKILFDITSNIGNSGIKVLSNSKEGIEDMYCSLLSYKYYYAAEPGEQMPGFGAMQGMEINKTQKTALICGYESYCAEVTFPLDRDKTYEVWYTKDIDVKNPNSSTPFEDIDGVVLKFFFLIGGVEMHFTAQNVYSKDVDETIFNRRTDYISVTKESMDEFIFTMINF